MGVPLADSETGEKSEEASPQKMRKARQKGQVSKSADAVAAMVFLGTASFIFLTVGTIAQQLADAYLESINATTRDDLQLAVLEILGYSMNSWLTITLPVIACAMLMGLLGNYFQIGFLFTADPLKPDIKRINPVNGVKQLFSKKRLVEVLKQLIKFSIVASVVYVTFKESLASIILTQRSPDVVVSVGVVGEIIKNIVIRVGILFLSIAAADYFWQRYLYKKNLMMSKYDVKQEYKESEGDPHQKSERKRQAQDASMHGSQQNTKNADAVVTNPAHIACAIKYDPEGDGAPVLISKGMRKNAAIIRQIAFENDVPVVRNVPLAQELNTLEVDEEIPESLFEIVAEILNFVYELKEGGVGQTSGSQEESK